MFCCDAINARYAALAIVTCDYVAEGSLCMSVKIGDMVVIGFVTDYKGYIFALDTFKDKSGYIPVSALSA